MMRLTTKGKRFARNRPWSPHVSVDNFYSACENIYNALKVFQDIEDSLKIKYDPYVALGRRKFLDDELKENSFILSINDSKYIVPVVLSDDMFTSYMYLSIMESEKLYKICICEHDIKELLANKKWFIGGLNHELKHCMEYILSGYKIDKKPYSPPDHVSIPENVMLKSTYPEIDMKGYVGYINSPMELRANIAQIIHEINNLGVSKHSLSSSFDYIKIINSALVSTLFGVRSMPVEFQKNLLSLFSPVNQKKIIWGVYKALND